MFSTVHKAKGLEFSTVQLLDDFLCSTRFHSSTQSSIPLGLLPEDEFNLLYVASTRAQNRLLMSQTLYSVMRSAGVRNTYGRLKVFVKWRLLPPVGKVCCSSVEI